MTPDLQGFELDADIADIGGHDPVSAVLDALGQAFGVVTEPGAPGSGARQHTWLDTFDWRLNRAGLVLDYEHKNRGGRLVLTRDEVPQAEQPVTGWRSGRPRLAEDLPAGPVRDQILKLASPRALLPMATAAGSVSVIRLLNEDGKTVARLVVDRSTVTRADQAVALPPRLAIAEVRGYPGQARRAARLLAETPGVSPARQTAFLEALHALGRHPDDYSNGVTTEITAQMPASVAVATLLLGLLDTVEQNVDGVLRDVDTEFLHDLRVASRRTRSAIKLLGDVLPDGLAAPYAAEFKWLGDLTTPTRDLDVHLLGFSAMAAQLVAASPADLEPFRAFLARRRTREFRRLAAGLRSPRFRALTDHWRKALLEVRDAGRPRKGPTADELAVSRTGRMFRRVVGLGSAITADSPPESLHNLRKRCKELRYVLEFFAPLHDPVAYRKVVGDLKQLQDCLGEFQDDEVQRHEIAALADEMLAERAAPAATLLAMGEIAANLAHSQAEARADFAERFTRFAGAAEQQRVRDLLEQARPVKIFATYNIKGGVGKTTAAVNLAYLSAADGYRTLLWDLDPQGAASFLFRIKPRVKGGGKALIRGTKALDDAIKGTDFEHLDLLPADFTYRNMDLILGDKDKKPTRQIAQLLRPLAGEYDHVFLDCPPSISLVSENVMHAADVLLVPLIPTTLSVRTLDQLTEFVAGFDGRQPEILAFFSMVDRRKRLHQEIAEKLLAERSNVAATPIPALSLIERMSVERAPVIVFAPRSQAALAFRALWAEISDDEKTAAEPEPSLSR